MKRLLAVVVLAALAGCSSLHIAPYRMEIQQGNFISQEMVAQLKPGMTKDQVRFALGTPLLVDPFHSDRWDYVFARTPENSRESEQRRITVFFDGKGTLDRIEGDVVTAIARPEAAEAK